jgi:anti-anti-sigma regulatory factor
MTGWGPTIVKNLPEQQSKLHRGLFLDEVKESIGQSYRPRLIVDLTRCETIGSETIDLLLECVEEVEHADGRVAVAASPETAVVLELTQLTSVLDLFGSVSEALSDRPLLVPMSISEVGTTQAAA